MAVKARRQASFKRWRERVRHSALHAGKEVFRHLQRATSNHLAGPDGSSLPPCCGLAHTADQWNQVFDVHQAGILIEPLILLPVGRPAPSPVFRVLAHLFRQVEAWCLGHARELHLSRCDCLRIFAVVVRGFPPIGACVVRVRRDSPSLPRVQHTVEMNGLTGFHVPEAGLTGLLGLAGPCGVERGARVNGLAVFALLNIL